MKIKTCTQIISVLLLILNYNIYSYKNFPAEKGIQNNKTNNGKILVSPNFRIHPTANYVQVNSDISRHPANPNAMLVSGFTVWPPGGNSGTTSFYWYSTNGGLNWQGNDTFNLTGVSNSASTIIDKNGTFILSHGGYPVTGVFGNYSTNFGQTWSLQNMIFSGPYGSIIIETDEAQASPYYGRTYTAWTFSNFTLPPIGLSYTTNGGTTWSPYIQLNNPPSDHYSIGSDIKCGPNGNIYITWASCNIASPYKEDYEGFAKSINGGVNWIVTENTFDANGIRGVLSAKNNIRVNSFPKIDVDRSGGSRNGWIYIAGCDKDLYPSGSDPDIILHRSTDGGNTWSSGIRVNQDPINNGKIQFFPAIRVDETGGINIIYYDDRNVSSNQCEVYLSRSADGGNTWTDYLISDHNFTPAPIPGLASGYQGDRIGGITSGNNKLLSVWADNSTGYYQIWAAIFDLASIGIENNNNNIPIKYRLFQNYPNPFNPSTIINYNIPVSSRGGMIDVKLSVFDILGREIAVLVNQKQNAGSYEIEFNGSNYASGLYYYKLTAGIFIDVKKMILVK